MWIAIQSFQFEHPFNKQVVYMLQLYIAVVRVGHLLRFFSVGWKSSGLRNGYSCIRASTTAFGMWVSSSFFLEPLAVDDFCAKGATNCKKGSGCNPKKCIVMQCGSGNPQFICIAEWELVECMIAQRKHIVCWY